LKAIGECNQRRHELVPAKPAATGATGAAPMSDLVPRRAAASALPISEAAGRRLQKGCLIKQ